MPFHQIFSVLFFSSLTVLPDTELLMRKVSTRIWPTKVEILLQDKRSKHIFVFGFHSNVLPTTSKFWMELQEIQKMYSMLFPTAWIRWTSQATMRPATNKQTCTEFRNRMLLIYRSQQRVDGQGLVTNLQADLPWFDGWSFWQFKGKKHHKRAKSCGKFKGGTGKKTLE